MKSTKIIDDTEEERDRCDFGGHGSEDVEITTNDVADLILGKVLAVDVNNEYVVFIKIKGK